MSAAESLSVGSVASIGSQEGGHSQTSAALSQYGPHGATAAFSTTQRSVVSYANETALSAVREDDGNAQSSCVRRWTPDGRGEGGTSSAPVALLESELDGADVVQEGSFVGNDVNSTLIAMQEGLIGGHEVDSTLAVMLSSVGNDNGSSVCQLFQGESTMSDHSVTKAKRQERRYHSMSTRHTTRAWISGAIVTHTPPPKHQPDTWAEQNGSLCSLEQSNSIGSHGRSNVFEDEVESCSGVVGSGETPRASAAIQVNFTDIPMCPTIRRTNSVASGSDCLPRGHTWPQADVDLSSLYETVNGQAADASAQAPQEGGRTSVGIIPSETRNPTINPALQQSLQHSLLESNDGIDSSPAGQASCSVHQPMQNRSGNNFGLKRKETSFEGDRNSGKRRHGV